MSEQQQPGKGIEPAYAASMPAPQGGALPTGLEWQALERMATTLADSDVIPYRLKRKPADVAVILLAAREYGIPPLMALSKLPVVNGTPAPMGELMVALILRAGHSIRADFKNPDGTRYKGGPLTPQHYGEALARRRDWDAGVEESLTFTLEEAVAAGLVTLRDGKPEAYDDKNRPLPWMLYTPNMARWRAVANIARLYFPDVLLGLSYLPEELGAMVDAEGAPIVGEVVENTPPRRAPGGTLEERSAQEAADRLTSYVGPVDVLDNVLSHAQDNGYADARVSYAGDTMTLRDAIAHRRDFLIDNTVAGEHGDDTRAQDLADAIHAGKVTDLDQAVADAEAGGYLEHTIRLGEGEGTLREYIEHARPHVQPAEAPEEPQKPAEEAPAPAPASEEPQDPAPAPQAVGMPATELARAALEERDVDALRGLWNMAAEAGVIDHDVVAVVGDDDLAALDLNGTVRLPLRGLLIATNGYVNRHKAAVRDLGEPMGDTPADTPGEDPWATDPQ